MIIFENENNINLEYRTKYEIPEEIANMKFYNELAFKLACMSLDFYFKDVYKSKRIMKVAINIENNFKKYHNSELSKQTLYRSYRLYKNQERS